MKEKKEIEEIAITDSEKNKSDAPSWHCSTYCRKVRHIYCEGQQYVKEDAQEQCPYFDEMLY